MTAEVPAGAPMSHVSPRQQISLNIGWQFYREDDARAAAAQNGALHLPCDPSNWPRVNVPHSVRFEPQNASGGRNFQGICWYRRALPIDSMWRNQVIILHLEGAMQVAEVWLNDRKIASHFCGYTPLVVELSPHLDFRDDAHNVLTIRLDNRDNPQVPPGKPQARLDFAYFGGLYRNVRLEVCDRLHLTDPQLANQPAGGGVFVTFPEVSRESASVRIRSNVRNAHAAAKRCVIRQQLIDEQGAIVCESLAEEPLSAGESITFEQTLGVVSPKLWHPHHPHLYRLRTTILDGELPVDELITRIGIRHLRFDRDDGFFINGEKFFALGANRHQDHPFVGYALPDSQQWRDVKKLRELGFTAFRSHYPQSPAFMDACDELGLLAIVSNPGWQFVGDELFRQRAIDNARAMVRRDRNRPSVILWEAALNESDNLELFPDLQRAIHEEYPGDQCFTAGDREHGERGSTDWDVQYLHNDGAKPYWIREWGDAVDNWSDQQSSNRVARRWGEAPMLVQAAAHLARMDELFVGHHGSNSGPGGRRLCGACLWAAIDCQRGYHHEPFYGGVLDGFRLAKFSAYLFQSQRPCDVHVAGLDDGPMVFIANFATFLSPTTVIVFSNCEQVRLLRDGQEIALQSPDAGHRIAHPPFTFNIGPRGGERSTMYMTGMSTDSRVAPPGELRAEALIGGRVVATHTVRPPGVASRLILEPDRCGRELVADESDWIRVYAKMVDSSGTLCPLGDDEITFAVHGEGQLLIDAADGAAIHANPIRAEAGIATALVRGNARAGKIIVTASAFGLKPATLELYSVASNRSPARESTVARRVRRAIEAVIAKS